MGAGERWLPHSSGRGYAWARWIDVGRHQPTLSEMEACPVSAVALKAATDAGKRQKRRHIGSSHAAEGRARASCCCAAPHPVGRWANASTMYGVSLSRTGTLEFDSRSHAAFREQESSPVRRSELHLRDQIRRLPHGSFGQQFHCEACDQKGVISVSV